jgi:hypothetical protein
VQPERTSIAVPAASHVLRILKGLSQIRSISRKQFFSEEKNQKTFASGGRG